MSFTFRIKKIPVNTRAKAFEDYSTYQWVHWGLGLSGAFLLTIYPALAFGIFLFVAYLFYSFIFSEYLEEPRRSLYERLLVPMATPQHFVQVGYEVPAEEPYFTRHLRALEKGGKVLQALEKKARREPWKVIGFAKSLLTQHFLIVGATGAGKTSLIMTLLKVIMKLGGGAVFVDGKGDTEMMFKCYRIAEKEGRTVDFFVISFIEPEKVGFDTNTMNPLSTLSAAGQITFFTSLATAASGGATGDKAYWLGRGKVLFQPVIYFNYMRKKFYGEPYSLETLNQYLSPEMFSELAVMATAMAAALNRRLEKASKLAKLRRDALKRYTPTTVVPTLEAVLNYLTQFPYRQLELNKIGIEFSFADLVYKSYNLAVLSYLKSLDQKWASTVERAGIALFEEADAVGKDLLAMNILELRQAVARVKQGKSFIDSLGSKKMLEQHGYAQNQWTETLQSLSVYSNVFGAADPDVDFADVVKNARLLYVLLPSLGADEKTRNMLGNIIVNAVKGAMAISLGGKLDNLSATASRILMTVLKPEPVGLLILDEYGAYPVPEIEVILAQARSLKWSVFLAVQDLTSLRVGGTNEHTLRRDWANTVNKFIMKNFDKETLEWLGAVMPKAEVLTEGSFEDADTLVPQGVLNAVQRHFLDPEKTQQFEKGFGVLLSNGKVCLMQTFWADEKNPEKLRINRFRKVV